ncbi:Putative protein of unknown function [Podospora comata]|uniref:NACHT-NTPase and P-loop NTPases N-terminal domain-containing protein n=1 Tax=Podospora comata TaxID=48703 RepID=A0ABY6SIW3_PODCO|nr:Putative protein of unknown function [Podospora comata]
MIELFTSPHPFFSSSTSSIPVRQPQHSLNSPQTHSIANFCDEVVTLVGALKEQLDVICDANIQLSSPRSKQARQDAKEILHMLKSNSAEVHERGKEIHHVTSLFRTQTLEDEKGLKGLIELLDAAVTEFMLYDAISKKMEEILVKGTFKQS